MKNCYCKKKSFLNDLMNHVEELQILKTMGVFDSIKKAESKHIKSFFDYLEYKQK